MKAVILAGSPGTARFPFANYFPKLGLPVANEPLLYHLAHHLETAGITEIAVSILEHRAAFRALALRINRHPDLKVKVKIFHDEVPLGTAGCLRRLKEFIGSSSVLVLSSSSFVSGDELTKIVEAHQTNDAALTVVAATCASDCNNLENFNVDEKGILKNYIVLHASRDRRSSGSCRTDLDQNRRSCYCSAGISVISPRALDLIPDNGGYMDINEQLIPVLDEAGIAVRMHVVKGPPPMITGLESYFQANRTILTRPGEDQDFVFRNSQQRAAGLWVGGNVFIHPSARITGPVLIGNDCIIEEDTVITGPAALGNMVRVRRGATVCESFLGSGARVGKGASVQGSLVAQKGVVKKGETTERSVIVNAKDLRGGLSLLPVTKDDGFKVCVRHGAFVPRVQTRRTGYAVLKRIVDVVAAAVLLVLLAPVFLLIAIAIKLEGDGPIFYSQRRCGKDGAEFSMHKFRTMVVNAHELQKEYADVKDVDGPMFKLEDDPRVTRMGRFLRDTSLDELPQLINVLKSEMSLVGPRPLVMQEMTFAPSWRDIRLSVKPGITGLWQVNGRHKVSFHDWIRNDIRYVRERSTRLDLMILLRTCKVLRGGANL